VILVRAIPARASYLLQVFFYHHIKDIVETLETLATSGMRWRWFMGYFLSPRQKFTRDTENNNLTRVNKWHELALGHMDHLWKNK